MRLIGSVSLRGETRACNVCKSAILLRSKSLQTSHDNIKDTTHSMSGKRASQNDTLRESLCVSAIEETERVNFTC